MKGAVGEVGASEISAHSLDLDQRPTALRPAFFRTAPEDYLLKRTYTFFLRETSGERFEPAILTNNTEALRHARLMLERDPNLLAVDVCFGDTFLFTLAQLAPEERRVEPAPESVAAVRSDHGTILVSLEGELWTARLDGLFVAACRSLPDAINQAWQASDAAAARGGKLGVRVFFPHAT